MSLLSKSIIGLDIHDYSVELVELKQKGNSISLESYNRVLIPAEVVVNGEIKKPEALKKIILDLIKTANPKPIETKNVALILPPSKVLTHIFSYPILLKEKDVKKSISYEAETVIPFSINDVYWDYSIINKDNEKDKNPKQHALFASINKDIADQYSALLESIGLSPYVFGINAEALNVGLAPQLSKFKTNLIIDAGTIAVNFLIVKNGKIRYFFGASEGGKKLMGKMAKEFQTPESLLIEKKEQAKFKTMPQMKEVKEFIRKNYQKAITIVEELNLKNSNIKIENVILTGEFLNLPTFYESAKIYFPNHNITIGDPKADLIIQQEKFEPINSNHEAAVPYSTHFTNAIGIAKRGLQGAEESEGINLLPGELKKSFIKKKTQLIVAIASILMTIFSLAIGTFTFYINQSLTYERNTLEIKREALNNTIYGTRYQEIRANINAFNDEINELSAIDQKIFSVPDTLNKVLKEVPEGINLKSIDFIDEELSITITGISTSREKLLELQDNFEKAAFSKEVVAPISNFDEKSQISFLIQINLDFSNLKRNGTNANTK